MGALVAVYGSGSSDEEAVQRGIRAAPHRGDRSQILTLGSCTLGVSSTEASSGWIAERGTIAVAFTGLLDNADEIRAATGDDSPIDPASVVAAAYDRFGERAAPMLRGAFAVAVSDGRSITAWRDQLGYRTLFHRASPGHGVVASEAKQVVAAAGITSQPDMEALTRVFFGSYGDDTPSCLDGVKRLPKSTFLRVDAASAATRLYWRPDALLETARLTDDEIRERFDSLMTQAVGRMMRGPDAVSLSGGIDSPAIAAYAAPVHLERYGTPLAGLSAVYPDQPAVDESRYVRLVAESLGMSLHTYERHAGTLDDVRSWVERFDGPVPIFLWPDAVTHYQAARDAGIGTLMNGAVAELVMDMRRFLVLHLLRSGRLGATVRELRLQRAKGVGPRGIVRQLASPFVPSAVWRAYLHRRPPKSGTHVPEWIDIRRANEGSWARVPRTRDRWRANQLGGFRGPGLSVEAHEVVQEVCGVHTRYPWADVDLWEFFLSLPAEVKFPEQVTKPLVRRLLRGRLPDEILDRRDKTVFNDSLLARADYEALRRWLLDPPERIPGVDYDLLHDRIESGDMGVFEYIWAKDLASVHAFLDLFR